jgi:ribosome-associated toxin RatA of RatAB toxin-antitoxin module
MYTLVDTVEDYPQFLPWCGGARRARAHRDLRRGGNHISYHGVRQSFVTRNQNRPPERIDMKFVRGPFRSLAGHWHFTPLGDIGCRIEFSLDYEFSNHVLERLVGPIFDKITDTFVDAFVRRADAIYP